MILADRLSSELTAVWQANDSLRGFVESLQRHELEMRKVMAPVLEAVRRLEQLGGSIEAIAASAASQTADRPLQLTMPNTDRLLVSELSEELLAQLSPTWSPEEDEGNDDRKVPGQYL